MSLNFFGAGIEEVKKFATIGERIKRGRTGCTTEKTKEEKKASKLHKENEELQHLVQNIEHILKENKKKSINALRRGYDR